MVEHAAVNRVVVGSSPTSGAIRLGPQKGPRSWQAIVVGRVKWG